MTGLFASRAEADLAARGLVGGSRLWSTHVDVFGPPDGETSRDDMLGRAMEPEQRGSWVTVLRAHPAMGVRGFLGGARLFAPVWRPHEIVPETVDAAPAMAGAACWAPLRRRACAAAPGTWR